MITYLLPVWMEGGGGRVEGEVNNLDIRTLWLGTNYLCFRGLIVIV